MPHAPIIQQPERAELLFQHGTVHLDEYCERHGPGFWGEPINAITNFCIVFAGLMILRMYRRDIVTERGRHYPMFLALIAMVIALGLGSFIWHTFATVWAMWFDLVPIILLIYCYQWAVLRLIFRWSRRETAIYTLLFSAFTYALIHTFGDQALNGSVIYVPAVGSLVWFGLRMRSMGKRGGGYMAAGVATFLLAIYLRTIDMAVCDHFPIGTHFTWHFLNSFMVYFLAKALVLGYAMRPPRPRVRPARRGGTM